MSWFNPSALLNRQGDERIAIEKPNNPLRFAGKTKDAFFPELRKRAGNRFDRQPEIVGNIGAGHHHVEFRILGMAVGHLLNEGSKALQGALLADDELLALRLCEIRQGNVQKIDRDDRVLIGAKRSQARFADGFCKIRPDIAAFEPEPFALAAEG